MNWFKIDKYVLGLLMGIVIGALLRSLIAG